MKTPVAILLALFVLILNNTACDKDDQDTTTAVRIGAVYCLTGSQAVLDIPSSQGASLAVDALNRTGGILGMPVELILRDGESDSSVVRQDVKDLISGFPDVAGVLGLSDTDLALAGARQAKETGHVFLTSGATSPLLPGQVPGYLYLACFGDNVQAAAGAEWAYDSLEARTAIVLFDSTKTYTVLLHRYFMERFSSLGGQVVHTQGYDGSDISQLGQGLPQADMIFLSAEIAPDAIPIILQLRQLGIDLPIVGGDGYDAEDAWAFQPQIGNVYFTTHAFLGPANTNPLVTQFRTDFESTFNGVLPTSFAALGYDAVMLLAAAIESAGTTSPSAVRQHLADLQSIQGVTGVIGYPNGQQIPQKSVTIMRVQGGAQQFVLEFVPQMVPEP